MMRSVGTVACNAAKFRLVGSTRVGSFYIGLLCFNLNLICNLDFWLN